MMSYVTHTHTRYDSRQCDDMWSDDVITDRLTDFNEYLGVICVARVGNTDAQTSLHENPLKDAISCYDDVIDNTVLSYWRHQRVHTAQHRRRQTHNYEVVLIGFLAIGTSMRIKHFYDKHLRIIIHQSHHFYKGSNASLRFDDENKANQAKSFHYISFSTARQNKNRISTLVSCTDPPPPLFQQSHLFQYHCFENWWLLLLGFSASLWPVR